MQATQHALGRATVVVLHKVYVKPGGLTEDSLVEAFKEEATGIAEDFGFDDENCWDRGRDNLQDCILSSSNRSKY